MRKITALFLFAILLATAVLPAAAAQPEGLVSPLLLNTAQADVTIAITEDGLCSMTVTCIGKSTATGISTVTYLERKVGSSWVRVDTGTTDDQWLYNVTASRLVKNYKLQLTIKGEYRVTSVVTVTGSAGTETLTLQNSATY